MTSAEVAAIAARHAVAVAAQQEAREKYIGLQPGITAATNRLRKWQEQSALDDTAALLAERERLVAALREIGAARPAWFSTSGQFWMCPCCKKPARGDTPESIEHELWCEAATARRALGAGWGGTDE